MQRSKIKAGRTYAYTDGTKMYGSRYRIKVLDTAFPFERTVRTFGEYKVVTEPGIQAVRVGEDGEPVMAGGAPARPFQITKIARVIHTWDEELAEREAKKAQAEREAQQRATNVEAQEQLRQDLLSFLGPNSTAERERIASAEIRAVWGGGSDARLVLGDIDGKRLLSLLNQAYQAGHAKGADETDERRDFDERERSEQQD